MQSSTTPLVTERPVSPKPPKRTGRFLVLLATIAIVLVFGAVILPRVKLEPGAIVISLPTTDTVITQIQNIGRVETVSYTLEKVIPYDMDASSPWHFLGDHTKLFVVHGVVIAGFDLTKLSKQDVQIQQSSKTVTMNLPPPQILSSNLDEGQMKVYDSNSGLTGLWNSQLNEQQELDILGAAKQSLQSDACKGDILQKASASAKQQFTSFLKTVGFQTVHLSVPDGTC